MKNLFGENNSILNVCYVTWVKFIYKRFKVVYIFEYIGDDTSSMSYKGSGVFQGSTRDITKVFSFTLEVKIYFLF